MKRLVCSVVGVAALAGVAAAFAAPNAATTARLVSVTSPVSTQRAGEAGRKSSRASLQDHRPLQERPFTRPGPQPQVPHARARVMDVDVGGTRRSVRGRSR